MRTRPRRCRPHAPGAPATPIFSRLDSARRSPRPGCRTRRSRPSGPPRTPPRWSGSAPAPASCLAASSRTCRSTSTRTVTFIIAPAWCSTGPFATVKGATPPAAHKERLSFECLEGETHAGAHVAHGLDDGRIGGGCAQADDAAVVGHVTVIMLRSGSPPMPA